MAEQIDALREWAKERTVPANQVFSVKGNKVARISNYYRVIEVAK